MIIFFWVGLKKDPNLLPSMLVNKSVPLFSAISLSNSDEVINSSELSGKITLLNIWASWCQACQIEHPILIDLAKANNIQLYGLDYKDERQSALSFLAKVGNPYQKNIFDPQGKIAMQLGVYGTPETFLIDKKGLVRYRYVGPITLEILENDLLQRIKNIEQEG